MKELLDKIEEYHRNRHLLGKVDKITAIGVIEVIDLLRDDIMDELMELEGSEYDEARNAFLAL